MNLLHPLSILSFTAALAAQITTIGPFTGVLVEEFETTSYSACVPGRVFHNHADFCTPGHNGVIVTSSWLLYVGYTMYPRNSSNSFAGTTLGHGVFTFDEPVQRFGAWFGTVGYLAGGSASFFDVNNALIATLPVAAPRGNWAWNGWDVGHGGTKIKRVELVANDPYNGGALICVEDAQADVAVGSITTSPLGCGTLAISATGLPVLGDTVTLALGSSASFQGFVAGVPIAPFPVAPCPTCQVGVSGMTIAGRTLVLGVPNNPAFLDMSIGVQGFRFSGGPCLGMVSISDRVEIWIGIGN